MLPAVQTFSVLILLALFLMVPQHLESEPTGQHGFHQQPDTEVPTDRISTSVLHRIIQPITTVTEYEDGTVEHNTGNGFFAGRMFFTVNHNLESTFGTGLLRKTSFVDGVAVTPTYHDPSQDLAVFDLPPELCSSHCNGISLNARIPLEPGQSVFWLRKFEGSMALKEGRVVDYAWIGEGAETAGDVGTCDGRLIVQIDKPFLPGSSGSPVVDSNTGQIVGIIQGSLVSGHGETGFFKPLSCLARPEVTADIQNTIAASR